MQFFELLASVRPQIEAELLRVIEQAKRENGARFEFDDWLLDEAARRVTRGKLMRGGLLIGAYEALGGSNRRAGVQAAAALELYGTGLLMQDDVTDCSLSRRGLPTIHAIAREKAQLLDMHNPVQVGDNIAVYLADTLYFLAQELLAHLEVDPVVSMRLSAISARELWQLGLAQIEDLRCANLSPQTSELSRTTILQLYAGKTGRYSVSWPLQLGAVMAGSSTEQRESLAKLGTEIGVLYQLRDDELGLFGNPDELGKSVDDDLRDGKKTLYWLALREQVDQDDPLWQTFGMATADTASIEKLRTHIRTSGIEQSVHDLITQKQTGLSTEIEASELTPPIKSLLTELLTFVVERKK